jgi:beta-galactosidase
VSEYDADSDGRLHSLAPAQQDYSTEWAQRYHQSYVQQLEARPYLSGFAVWNSFDFGSETRGESVPHMNKKGLFTFDRHSSFGKGPVLHIATREWARRTGTNMRATPNEAIQSVSQPVEVYSNLPAVELLLDGKTLGVKQFGKLHVGKWDVPFHDGANHLEARGQSDGKQLTDSTDVRFVYRAPRLMNSARPFVLLAVNVGSSSQFTDAAGLTWEADQAYSPGGWGYVGGSEDNTALNVLGTEDDPLYRTFRRSLKEYRFDVPDGNYEVELRFVEPGVESKVTRVFSITMNEKTLIDKLDLVRTVGSLRAAARTVQASAAGGNGIDLHFQQISGETLLSAIRIQRLP